MVAYALESLAAASKDTHIQEMAELSRKDIEKSMSAQQIETAKKLIQDMAKPGNLLPALDRYLNRQSQIPVTKSQ